MFSITFEYEGTPFVLWYPKNTKQWLLEPIISEENINKENLFYKTMIGKDIKNSKLRCDGEEFAQFLFHESNLRLKLLMNYGPNFFEIFEKEMKMYVYPH